MTTLAELDRCLGTLHDLKIPFYYRVAEPGADSIVLRAVLRRRGKFEE